jgi:hypothetical protein
MLRTSLWLLAGALGQIALATPELNLGYYASPQGNAIVVDSADDASFHLVAYSPASLDSKCVIEGDATYRKGSREEANFQWNGCRYQVKAKLGEIPELRLRAENTGCNTACSRKLFLTGQDYMYQYPGCASHQIERRREDFLGQLGRKRFEEAYTTLVYTFDHCLTYLEDAQEAWVYADLAMAAFKKGDPKRCLDLLEKYGTRPAPNERVGQAMEIHRKLCQDANPRA